MKRYVCLLALLLVMLAGSAHAQGWKAIPVDKTIVDGKVRVGVAYALGDTVRREEYDFAEGDAYSQLQNRIASRLAALNSSITLDGKPVDTPKPQPPPPIDQARQDYASLLTHYRQLQRAIDVGVLMETDPDVKATLDQLKAGYRPEYLEMF